MKVYVVEWFSASYETGMAAVFSTEELAEKWASNRDWKAHFCDGYTILELELDSPDP
jgi:hypothetical protein